MSVFAMFERRENGDILFLDWIEGTDADAIARVCKYRDTLSNGWIVVDAAPVARKRADWIPGKKIATWKNVPKLLRAD